MSTVIVSAGARSALGATLEQTAFGVRAGKLCSRRTTFLDASSVAIGAALDRTLPLDITGPERWVLLAAPALREALRGATSTNEPVPMILLTSTSDTFLGRTIVDLLLDEVNLEIDRKNSLLLSAGSAGIALALKHATDLLNAGMPRVIVGAVDSSHAPTRYEWLDAERRILSERSADGFIPSEGAAFFVMERGRSDRPHLARITRLCLEEEDSPDIAEKLTVAVEGALATATSRVQSIIVDTNGERHRERTWSFVTHRLKEEIDLDITRVVGLGRELGDSGVALGALAIAIGCAGFASAIFPPAPLLVAIHGDESLRAAVLLEPS